MKKIEPPAQHNKRLSKIWLLLGSFTLACGIIWLIISLISESFEDLFTIICFLIIGIFGIPIGIYLKKKRD